LPFLNIFLLLVLDPDFFFIFLPFLPFFKPLMVVVVVVSASVERSITMGFRPPLPPDAPVLLLRLDTAPGRSNPGETVTPGCADAEGMELGASLGASVGESLGASLGASVGVSLGASLGASVGVSLGTSLGTSLGDEVGAFVGDELGASVGGFVSVGVRVVTLLGAAEGASEHPSLFFLEDLQDLSFLLDFFLPPPNPKYDLRGKLGLPTNSFLGGLKKVFFLGGLKKTVFLGGPFLA